MFPALIRKWDVNGGTFELLGSGSATLGRYSQEERMQEVSGLWIRGLPKGRTAEELRNWTRDSYVQVRKTGSDLSSVDILHRLPGGMLAAAAAGLGAVGSGFGFLSSGNYVRLAKEAQAAIRIAGRECRATIDHAEVAVNRTVDNMHAKVNDTVRNASVEARAVLTHNRREMERIITAGGAEARYTARAIEAEMERLLSSAGNETIRVMNGAGVEVRKTLQDANREAQELVLLMSNETSRAIREVSLSTNQTIVSGSREIEGILVRARQEMASVIRTGGQEFALRLRETVLSSIEAMEQSIGRVQQGVEAGMGRLIRQAADAVDAIVLNLGDQGRLLIQETGTELRVSADRILASWATNSEMLIDCAGEQARLTVSAFGTELRSTLHEIPIIAGLAAEQATAGVIYSLIENILGAGELRTLIHRINRSSSVGGPVNIQNLISYIQEQHLNANERKELYLALIKGFNQPIFLEREAIFLFIGVAVLEDSTLIRTNTSWTGSVQETDLREEIVEQIPGRARRLLLEHSTRALEVAYRPTPQALPEVREIVFEEVEEEVDWEQHAVELQARVTSLENEVRYVSIQREEERVRMDANLETINQHEAEKRALQATIEELNGTIAQLRRRVRTLESDLALRH